MLKENSFKLIYLVLLNGIFLLTAVPGHAGQQSQLPLPRFVSFRAEEVNLRAGPETHYPIEWIYRKKYLPIEVIAEFYHWRKIKDYEGSTGWVHKSLLSGLRTGITINRIQTLLAKPQEDSKIIAYIEPEVIVQLKKCQGQWCYIETMKDPISGWLNKDGLFGVYPNEIIDE